MSFDNSVFDFVSNDRVEPRMPEAFSVSDDDLAGTANQQTAETPTFSVRELANIVAAN